MIKTIRPTKTMNPLVKRNVCASHPINQPSPADPIAMLVMQCLRVLVLSLMPSPPPLVSHICDAPE